MDDELDPLEVLESNKRVGRNSSNSNPEKEIIEADIDENRKWIVENEPYSLKIILDEPENQKEVEINKGNHKKALGVFERLLFDEDTLRSACRKEYDDSSTSVNSTTGFQLEEFLDGNQIPEDLRNPGKELYMKMADESLTELIPIDLESTKSRERDYDLLSAPESEHSLNMELWYNIARDNITAQEARDSYIIDESELIESLTNLKERNLLNEDYKITQKSKALKEAVDFLYKQKKDIFDLDSFDKVEESDLTGLRIEKLENIYDNLLIDEIVSDLNLLSESPNYNQLSIFRLRMENERYNPKQLSAYMKARNIENIPESEIKSSYREWEEELFTTKPSPKMKAQQLMKMDRKYQEALSDYC